MPGLAVIGEAATPPPLAFLRGCLAEEPDGGTLPHLALMDLNMPGVADWSWPRSCTNAIRRSRCWCCPCTTTRNTCWRGARGYLQDEPAQEIITAIDAVMAGRYFSAAVAVRLSQASAPATLLTQRERDVLRHIAEGHANKQIAQALNLSVRTVETHRLNIKRKLGIDGQAELIKYAVENRVL